METALRWLIEYEYLAMVGLLTLCGVGLPMPEEVTLLSSGLLVGWHEANFWLTALACSSGILMGDSIIFGFGHVYGQRFLGSRPMRLLLSPARLTRVERFFLRHGTKALFLARFFPGVRIGVYAYAGSQRVAWWRFILLDLTGVLVSGPTSILIGKWAAQAFGDDRDEAIAMAAQKAHRLGHWFVLAALGLGLALAAVQWLRSRSPRSS